MDIDLFQTRVLDVISRLARSAIVIAVCCSLTLAGLGDSSVAASEADRLPGETLPGETAPAEEDVVDEEANESASTNSSRRFSRTGHPLHSRFCLGPTNSLGLDAEKRAYQGRCRARVNPSLSSRQSPMRC